MSTQDIVDLTDDGDTAQEHHVPGGSSGSNSRVVPDVGGKSALSMAMKRKKASYPIAYTAQRLTSNYTFIHT